MAHTITIHFPAEQDERLSLLSRLRNFGEHVSKYVRRRECGIVDLDEVDAATTHFSIRNVRSPKQVAAWVQQTAARQNLIVKLEVC